MSATPPPPKINGFGADTPEIAESVARAYELGRKTGTVASVIATAGAYMLLVTVGTLMAKLTWTIGRAIWVAV